VTFCLLGGFERGNKWWFAAVHGGYALALGARPILDAWLERRFGRAERVRRGRRWAFVTPAPHATVAVFDNPTPAVEKTE
jgi:hypothetical protein